ncbi:hypothetical protein [Streptomyces sp. ISL-1]|uniref:hypothetical protein n=1 Tax=Streptomyces sp. ISL-1 TaxID=2817657 RepID=UPI0020365E3A|nr:hypothetical protein [Streptomyces sp. ISL-1]
MEARRRVRHVRRLGIITDIEHQAVDDARAQVLAMLKKRGGPFANAAARAAWRWNPSWPSSRLPQSIPAAGRVAPTGG